MATMWRSSWVQTALSRRTGWDGLSRGRQRRPESFAQARSSQPRKVEGPYALSGPHWCDACWTVPPEKCGRSGHTRPWNKRASTSTRHSRCTATPQDPRCGGIRGEGRPRPCSRCRQRGHHRTLTSGPAAHPPSAAAQRTVRPTGRTVRAPVAQGRAEPLPDTRAKPPSHPSLCRRGVETCRQRRHPPAQRRHIAAPRPRPARQRLIRTPRPLADVPWQ